MKGLRHMMGDVSFDTLGWTSTLVGRRRSSGPEGYVGEDGEGMPREGPGSVNETILQLPIHVRRWIESI